MDQKIDQIEINGVKYIRADQAAVPAKPGKRAVVVVDRGWIFAGDVTDENGRIRITRAVHVRSWNSIGFDGMVANPKSKDVTLKPVANVDMPADAELFRVPVCDDWGA